MALKCKAEAEAEAEAKAKAKAKKIGKKAISIIRMLKNILH